MFACFFPQRRFSATKTKLRVRRPLHHGSLAARAPVVPLPRYRGGGRGRATLRLMPGEARLEKLISIHRLHLLLFLFPLQKKKGGGTPANTDPYPPHLAMRLAPFGRACLTAF